MSHMFSPPTIEPERTPRRLPCFLPPDTPLDARPVQYPDKGLDAIGCSAKTIAWFREEHGVKTLAQLDAWFAEDPIRTYTDAKGLGPVGSVQVAATHATMRSEWSPR